MPSAMSCSGSSCALPLWSSPGLHCAARPDRSVACWGLASIGNVFGPTARSIVYSPLVAPSLADVRQFTGGRDFICQLTSTGTVRCAGGLNSFGQLGDGTTTANNSLVTVVGVTDATSIAAGPESACAVLSGGGIRCWGRGVSGQLGDGTSMNRSTAVAVGGTTPVTDATAVTAGYGFTCALRTGGAVWCWGSNGFGGLGVGGGTAFSSTPVQTRGEAGGFLTGVTQLASGEVTTCAVRRGSVLCWGDGSRGLLGNGTTSTSLVPTLVSSLTDAVEVRLSQSHACARRSGGTVVCWGINTNGQLGDGTTTNRTTPVAVRGLDHVVGLALVSGTSCARRDDGTVHCWGNFPGTGVSETTNPTPAPLFGLP